jgi:microcompartment protein CcmK/EutM
MHLARVIGNVVVTRKDEGLAGLPLLVVQPLTPEREPPAGRSSLSIPSAPAWAKSCSSSRQGSQPRTILSKPRRRRHRGIVDHWDLEP